MSRRKLCCQFCHVDAVDRLTNICSSCGRGSEAEARPEEPYTKVIRELRQAFEDQKKLEVIGCCMKLAQLLQDSPERTVPDEVMLLLTPEMRYTALTGMCLVALQGVS